MLQFIQVIPPGMLACLCVDQGSCFIARETVPDDTPALALFI
jgi:hypothetical protein